jgi:hypothetical protein
LTIKDFEDKISETIVEINANIESKTTNKAFLKFCEKTNTATETILGQIRTNK